MQNKTPLKPIYYCILCGFILFSFFYGFAAFAIEDMNEGLYAEIAREMLALHSYVIPHLNFVPYLEKPPLLYWLIALSYHLFGMSAFAARLIPATAAGIISLACFWFGNAIDRPRAGWVTALMLASSVGYILVARVLIFDMVLTMYFTLALMHFYLWFQKERRYFLWLSYLFLGLAFMTKGMLPLILAFAIVVLFIFLVKAPWQKVLRLFDWVGIGLLLLTIVPWVVLATIQQPGFAWDFFVNEQIMRFFNQRIPRDYHTGPIYYYIPRILVYLFPWSLMLPLLFRRILPPTPVNKQLNLFLWLWFLVPLVFLSLSEAKGDYYMIIGMPPLALLLGVKISEYIKQGNAGWLFGVFVSFTSVLLLGVALVTFSNTVWFPAWLKFSALALPQNLIQPLPWIAVGLFMYAIFGGCLINYYRRQPLFTLILIAGLIIPAVGFYVFTKQQDQVFRSQIALADAMLKQYPEWPVYSYQDYEIYSSLPFYLQKPLTIIDTQSHDLYFGAHSTQAINRFITMPVFKQRAQTSALYLVLSNNKLPDFAAKMGTVKFCLVDKNEKVTVMVPCKYKQ